MKKILSLILSASLALFCTPAYARTENSVETQAAAQSCPGADLRSEDAAYVFQLSEDADPGQLGQQAEPLCEDARLYRTDDIALIRQLASENVIDQYAADGVISLDGTTEPILAAAKVPQDYRRAMLGYSYAEENGITGEGVKIAIIDSGLWNKFSSPATILPGVNFLVSTESADRSNVNDTYGHGTFVTSIICGDGIGLAPNVTILPLKCFDARESDYSYVIAAINEAIEEECDIINLSLGGTAQYPLLEEAVQLALDKGIIIVAASGNLTGSSTGNDQPNYPAAHEGVISVGAVDAQKTIWNKSVQNDSVCVVAPGAMVIGLSITSSGYATNNGTSFSAPLVSATAALALSADDTLTAADFTELLTSTAEDLGVKGKDNAYGHGLMNPALLLATIREDCESLILTGWNGHTGLSAYVTEQNAVNFLALCDENGQIISMINATRLNSYLLPPDVKYVSLISADSETYSPLYAARKMTLP